MFNLIRYLITIINVFCLSIVGIAVGWLLMLSKQENAWDYSTNIILKLMLILAVLTFVFCKDTGQLKKELKNELDRTRS